MVQFPFAIVFSDSFLFLLMICGDIARERKIYMLNAFDNNADRLTKYVIVCIVFEIVLNCNHSLEMRDAWKTNFTCHLQMDENFRFSKHLNLASINKPLFYRYVILRHCVRISHSPPSSDVSTNGCFHRCLLLWKYSHLFTFFSHNFNGIKMLIRCELQCDAMYRKILSFNTWVCIRWAPFFKYIHHRKILNSSGCAQHRQTWMCPLKSRIIDK